MLTDIEIAQQTKMEPIIKVAAKLGIENEELELYGPYKAKLSDALAGRIAQKADGKLILVTAINPTPAGEGKTTTTVGLGMAMHKLGKRSIIALREPSLGPVFGMKGGAAGGGYAQVVPMEDINLHFTGDLHAVTTANNLLCALIDNHLQQGNTLGLDSRTINFKRCMDQNDRALRNIVVGLGGAFDGVPREDGFNITAASEIMAILCLAMDLADLKKRLGDILIGFKADKSPVYCRDLGVQGALAALLKDALKPNLVQTLEGSPCLMHGGPFANIAHGCNSLRATRLGLKLADYCITEAGFGADLGAEKFFDIKCRVGGLTPSAVVLVATVRALKHNGGVAKADLPTPNPEAVERGLCNLIAHIENIHKFGLPVVVALNRFHTDSDEEIALLENASLAAGADFALNEGFAKGGEGAVELARKLIAAADKTSEFKLLYSSELSIEQKIRKIAQDIYGATDICFEEKAKKSLAQIQSLGLSDLPVCIAKTQYSLSDNAALLGRPKGFMITVRQLRISSGAGFIVALTGEIMTMPGLPKAPAAMAIDIDDEGKITGLF